MIAEIIDPTKHFHTSATLTPMATPHTSDHRGRVGECG